MFDRGRSALLLSPHHEVLSPHHEFERDCDRLGNLILNPFQINNDTQENLFNPDTILFDKGVIESRYYIANEFTNLTGHNQTENSQVSFSHLNIRSYRNKYDKLINYMNLLNFPFSVMALTETWLNETDGDNYNIEGYNFIQRKREHKSGGGIALYIKDNLNAVIRDDINNGNNTDSIESLFVEIQNPNGKNMTVGVIYRPPNNKINEYEESISSILAKIDKESKPCYLMGDFNIDLLKYESCKYSNRFLQQLSSSMKKKLGKPWITKGIITSTRKKNKLYRKFLRKPNINNELRYKRYKNKLNHVLRIAKKKYYSEQFEDSKNDIKSTWKTINELLNKTKTRSKLPTSIILCQ